MRDTIKVFSQTCYVYVKEYTVISSGNSDLGLRIYKNVSTTTIQVRL